MLPALLLFAGCTGGDATSPENSPNDVPGSGLYAWRPRESTPVALLVSPSSVIAETNQLLQFRARGRNRAGDEVVAPVTWSTTGGTILPDGRFSAASVGSYQVTGSALTSAGTEMVQTSTITVVRRQAKLKSVVVTPGSTTLNPGVSQTFAAIGLLASGDTVPIGVSWSARGGTIDAGGLYVAGDTVGTFRVIAIKNAGTLADTATVNISAPVSPPPPSDSVVPPTIPLEPPPPPADTAPTPPPPAPVLAQVALLPASVTLAPGTTKQFSAYGRTTTGDSIAVSVSLVATGGTITPGGLYTAGTTAGSFKVIAAASGLADTSTVTISAPLGSGTTLGVPYGASANWDGTSLKSNTSSFNLSTDAVNADLIINRINAARAKGVKLILAMTGGKHSNYITNGVFDMAKWIAKMNTFNTSAIKTAVAAGVADGTILGDIVMDEPNHYTWGPAGTMTKLEVDGMASYVKSLFPTLTVGVSQKHNAFEPTKSYKVIDFIVDGYDERQGTVASFRDAGLALARRDGHTVIFGVNVLDGGTIVAGCPIPETGGTGTFSNRCRVTPEQLEAWSTVLGPAGCAFSMWQYDSTFMASTDNQRVFRTIAALLATAPRTSCRRS
jgi:hypothetical protein